MKTKGRIKTGALPLILFFVAVVVLFWYFRAEFKPASIWVLQKIAELGWIAPVVFLVAETLMVVFILPGLVFNLGAGFLFGVTFGSLLAVIGTTLGASIAFYIGKFLNGKKAADTLLKSPKVEVFNRFLKIGGWKGILITRLVPMFPFKFSNYYFGLAGFKLRDFVTGTFLGIIPLTILNVYLGSMAADLATLGTGSRSPAEWTIYFIGLTVAVVLALIVFRKARLEFAAQSSQNKQEQNVNTY